MYSVVDPTYKAIAVACYLCISVRWIIYHIDMLGSCYLPWWFSSDQQFLFLMADLRLLHASVMQLLHDHFLIPVCGDICIVLGYLKWPCSRDPSCLHPSFVSLSAFLELALKGGVGVN